MDKKRFVMMRNKDIIAWIILVLINLITSYFSPKFYFVSFFLMFVVLMYITIKYSTGKDGLWNSIFNVIFAYVISLAIALYYNLNHDWWMLIILLIVLLMPVIPLYVVKDRIYRKSNKWDRFLYIIFWPIETASMCFFILFMFGVMDFEYLEDIAIQVNPPNPNMNILSDFVYFCMIGYHATLTFLQDPIEEKIRLVTSDTGTVFSCQIVIMAIVTFAMMLCIPKEIKEFYKDIKS